MLADAIIFFSSVENDVVIFREYMRKIASIIRNSIAPSTESREKISSEGKLPRSGFLISGEMFSRARRLYAILSASMTSAKSTGILMMPKKISERFIGLNEAKPLMD